MSVNTIALVGRVAMEPELRDVGDTTVANFNIATDRSYTQKGEDKPKTDFIPVMVWGKSADFVGRNFRKGSLVRVIGSLEQHNYTHNGKKVYTFRVKAESVGVEVFAKEEKEKEADFTDFPTGEFEDNLPFDN